MGNDEAHKKQRTRDQERALHAYQSVAEVKGSDEQKDYKIAVNDFGTNILRSGLCAALASVQRKGDGQKLLLKHLAEAKVIGLEDATKDNLAKLVRELDVDGYIIATREMLKVAVWFKRAVQATFEEKLNHAQGS